MCFQKWTTISIQKRLARFRAHFGLRMWQTLQLQQALLVAKDPARAPCTNSCLFRGGKRMGSVKQSHNPQRPFCVFIRWRSDHSRGRVQIHTARQDASLTDALCRAALVWQQRDQRELEKASNAEQANGTFCTYALSYEKGSSEMILDAEMIGNVSRYAFHRFEIGAVLILVA